MSAESLEVRPEKTNYNGHGGRRANAGRPPELGKQLAEAKSLAKQLNGAVRSGLLQLAENYDSLIELAINQAALGDTKVLLRLLELPAKMGLHCTMEKKTHPRLCRLRLLSVLRLMRRQKLHLLITILTKMLQREK